MLYEIKSWVDGCVLFSADCESLKVCVELAVKSKVSLNYAELNGAKLNYAKLNGAELNGAKLNGAKLNYAKLNGAKLNGADLIRVDGFNFSVVISLTHIHVGCKRWTKIDFLNLTDDEIRNAGGDECVKQYPIIKNLILTRDEIYKDKDK